MGMKTTYGRMTRGQEKSNTNKKIAELVNEELSRLKKKRSFKNISTTKNKKTIGRLGTHNKRGTHKTYNKSNMGIHHTFNDARLSNRKPLILSTQE